MPDPVRSLDRIKVASPCTADWDAMIGTDQVRFCEHCNLHVTDLSNMTRQNAMRLVARSRGRLCVRYIQRPNGGVLTKQIPEKLYRISRRVSRIAAGAFTATLSVSGAMAQTRADSNSLASQEAASASKVTPSPEQGAGLSGVVTDQTGAVIAGATVTLTSSEYHVTFSYATGDDGAFQFSFLDPGAYNLVIEGAGFERKELSNLVVSANANKALALAMEIRQLTAEVRVEADSVEVTVQGGAMFVMPEEPLVKAAFEQDLNAVRELLLSFNVNVRDKATEMTALDQAVENGNCEIVKTLISAGANARFESEKGRTALMYLRDNATVDLVRDLISAGANVNARDQSGQTALMNAASMSNFEVVKELLEAGAKVDSKDSDGTTALMLAASNQDPRITRLLIEAGANVNGKDEEGKTALMMAAVNGNAEAIKTLIDAGAEINARDEDGQTALVRANQIENILILLDAGADMSIKDNKGQTALGRARKSNQEEIVKLLESRGAP
jgi:ankyrin repeat protein